MGNALENPKAYYRAWTGTTSEIGEEMTSNPIVKKFTFTGVVQKVEWQNPHMRVYVDVTDASGKVTTWNMEMTSPNTVRRQGWGPNDLLQGEKVTFTTFGGKVIETRGSLVSIKNVSDGRELFVAGGPDASVPK